jgi:hypothetical protein
MSTKMFVVIRLSFSSILQLQVRVNCKSSAQGQAVKIRRHRHTITLPFVRIHGRLPLKFEHAFSAEALTTSRTARRPRTPAKGLKRMRSKRRSRAFFHGGTPGERDLLAIFFDKGLCRSQGLITHHEGLSWAPWQQPVEPARSWRLAQRRLRAQLLLSSSRHHRAGVRTGV